MIRLRRCHDEAIALHFDPERFWQMLNKMLTQEERDKVNGLLDEGDTADINVKLDPDTNEITFIVRRAEPK